MTGDVQQFDDLYVGSRDRLAAQLVGLTGDAAEAQDLVQEAFMRAWLLWETVSGYQDPEGWVRRVAVNMAVSRWRRARHLVLRPGGSPAEVDVPAVDGDPVVAARVAEAVGALDALPDGERRALTLHHLAGWSVEDIAGSTGTPQGTVKSWLSRGRRRLAGSIGNEEGDHDQ